MTGMPHALSRNPSPRAAEITGNLSRSLPCRISVCKAGGATKLATIKPTAMIGVCRTPELARVAEEVEATIVAIMAEAAG